MIASDILSGLLRRWYIVCLGLLLAGILAGLTWSAIPPKYERSAEQLLLPGVGTLPEGSTNPFLYLGGVANAAEVMTRAVGSDNTLNEIAVAHPGASVEVDRDTSTAGPFLHITVTSNDEVETNEALAEMVRRTPVMLEALQEEEDVKPSERITVIPVTIDQQSKVTHRNRQFAAVSVAVVVVILTLLLASFIDGVAQRRRAERVRQTFRSADLTTEDSDERDEAASGDANVARTMEKSLAPPGMSAVSRHRNRK